MAAPVFEQRYNSPDKTMMQPPYDRIVSVDISSDDWEATDDNIVVCEIRNKTAGNLIVDTTRDTSVTIGVDSYDTLRLNVTKIHKLATGTTAGTIVVLGYQKTS